MKIILNLIVCSTAIWALFSCVSYEDDKPSTETEKSGTIVEHPDSVRPNNLEQDASITELMDKVDTLTVELSSTRSRNADLQENLANLKSPINTWTYVSIVAIILGLVALVVAFFRNKGIKEERVIDIVEKCLDDSHRIKELQVNVNKLLSLQRNSRTVQAGSSNEPNSDSRLYQLERQMTQVVEVVNKLINPVQNPVLPSQETPKSHGVYESPRVGYAKVDTDNYFTTIYESNQEGCVFKITFTSQSMGRFNIIALDKIQSRNDWQKKIECSGISIKEASDFRLEDEGVCEKIDEKTWKVTKPLKIRLLK